MRILGHEVQLSADDVVYHGDVITTGTVFDRIKSLNSTRSISRRRSKPVSGSSNRVGLSTPRTSGPLDHRNWVVQNSQENGHACLPEIRLDGLSEA